ncbi:MAG: hypothetical protein WHS87_03150 [Anaerolineales bacterium]
MSFVRKPFHITRGMILGSLLVTFFLCLLTWGWLIGFSSGRAGGGAPSFQEFAAALTVLPAPTSTASPSPTPPITPTASIAPGGEGIVIGAYVQISGTEGQGLRLRAAPGLSGTLLFLGYDAEVYQVRDGPRQVDGYTWWYLVAPYDETRAGWAAADFLTVIATPQP